MKTDFLKNWIICLLVPICLLLSLFISYEPAGEAHGYWAFSRITMESGLFIMPERSPLYTLYLIPFQLIGYPISVSIEYLATTLITLISIIVFSKRYIGLRWSILISILWIPFLQMNPPPVQKLALACSLFAVSLRLDKNQYRWTLSYALLLMAYMFRSSYLLLLLLFLFWDIYNFYLKDNKALYLKKLKPRLSDSPLILIVAMFIIFGFLQSPHIWNNQHFTTITWFPGADQGLMNASVIQSFNWRYIENEFGTFIGKDFYFTNQELFGGATTLWGAILSNPSYVFSHIYHNTFDLIYLIRNFIGFLPMPKIVSYFIFLLGLWGLVMAFFQDRSGHLRIFILGSVIMLGTLILIIPKVRYLFPLIPLLIISSTWIASKLKKYISRIKLTNPYKVFISGVSVFIILCLFSPSPIEGWVGNGKDIVKNIWTERRVLTSKKSLKSHVSKIENLFSSCNGIMAYESLFLVGNTQLEIDKIVDMWEIPPFGSYANNQASYNGLSPERVDCLLISDALASNVGMGTNIQMRYQNYILPYVETLGRLGAKRIELTDFGYAIVLR